MRVTKTVASKAFVIVVLALAVCALMQAPNLIAKDPVTRPFRAVGQITIMDLSSAFPFTSIDQGVCSQTGKYVSVGKYPEGVPGFGITYTANGDQIFWKDLGGGVVEFTGGTGRFQGVTGGFTFSVTSSDIVPGPQGTWNQVVEYTAEGTITY